MWCVLAFSLVFSSVANGDIVRLITKPSCNDNAAMELPPKALVQTMNAQGRTLAFDPCGSRPASTRGSDLYKRGDHFKKRANLLLKAKGDAVPATLFEHAIAQRDGQTRAVKGAINLWSPSVALKSEYSLTMVRLVAGSTGNENVVEAGVHVFPKLYGDSKLHYFVSWTADGFKKTGCYNVDCVGFVQVEGFLVVGNAVPAMSSVNGSQFEQEFLISQAKSGDWIFFLGDREIGHWPANLFNALGKGATISQWGGEVSNSLKNNKHTATDMGSGEFAVNGFAFAAFIRHLQFGNENQKLVDAKDARTESDAPGCYSTSSLSFDPNDNDWSVFFFYGGPGFSSTCA